jgi:hypothetical protein
MTTRETDMSPAAVSRRHEEMRQLYKLMMYLRHAKVIGPVEPGDHVVIDRRTNDSDR